MVRNRLRAFEGPWALLDQIQRDAARVSGCGEIPVNVWTDSDEATVAMEVPGLDAGGIDVSVDGNLLTVRGEREGAAEDGDGVLAERSSGGFTRSVRLPFDAEAGDVTATYRRGVLLISVPKAEADRPTRVPVLAG